MGGSSPLTRGKPSGVSAHTLYVGLIPAHAGKTKMPRENTPQNWAHPRSRGENGNDSATAVRVTGSSPLTRGKRKMPRENTPQNGLIPAHAGKTIIVFSLSLCCWAHPRSRGENLGSTTSAPTLRGSSPLTRGKRHWGRRQRDRRLAHPRSRGENRRRRNGRGHPPGLIPAHAGKTNWRRW